MSNRAIKAAAYWKQQYDLVSDRLIVAEAGLAGILQIDDATYWKDGHTGKMNAMAFMARKALKGKYL